MSLRWRVALSLAAIAVLSTIAIGTVSYRTTRDRLLDSVDQSLVDVEGRVLQELRGRDGRLPERGPLSDLSAQIVARDGTVIDSTFPTELPVDEADLDLIGERGVDRFSTVDTASGNYRVRTVAFARGAIQIGRPVDEVEQVLRGLRSRIALWSLIVGAAACAVGWWIASRVTASLRTLTVAAEHVESTGRFDVDVGAARHDEVGRLAGAFDRMLAALRRSKDDQRRLVQDAGHELRTPLTSLRTNLDVLQRYPNLSSGDRDAIVADLRAETDELTELVNEIVTVASGETSDEPFVTIDLGELVNGVAERYGRRTGRTISVSATPTRLAAQRSAVQRAVSCLLDNARKFDPSDSSIDVTVDGSTVIVADRGPGIATLDLDHVFERFYRSDTARSEPGSGLGLSIVDAVARRHGGEAFARPREGGGAEVGFRLATLPAPEAPPSA